MNYAFLPDLSALALLMVILLLVRRRHPDARASAWVLGLFFTLIEATAHTFYPRHVMPISLLHVTVVDCYLLAGLVFIWASGNQQIIRGTRLAYVVLNGVPLLALTTIYGMNIRVARVYVPIVVVGFLTGILSSIFVRRDWVRVALYAAAWSAIGVLCSQNNFRAAIYWTLACIYGIAAINFQRRLDRGSTGRFAIVIGFSIWALCFLIHPWVVDSQYAEVVSHIWTMQKSLISIGMILIMLEGQVSNNEWLALHDELTGLPNRRMFSAKLSLAIEHADRKNSSLALVVLDLNGFKNINDSFGHLAGDYVLREVATTLRRSIRAADTVARLGGDEFIIVAQDMASEHSVQRFAESIRTAVDRPILFNGQPMNVTASLGVAIYPHDATDSTRLLRLADQRMYSLKRRPVQPAQIEGSLAALAPPA